MYKLTTATYSNFPTSIHHNFSSLIFANYQLIMVFFTSIVVSLFAISISLASPAIPVERNIVERDLPDFDLSGFNATAFSEGLRRRQTANYNQKL
jgi:hypothetical protein